MMRNRVLCASRCALRIALCFALCVTGMAALAACSSGPRVTRVGFQEDLSGYWNNNDVKLVCESLINQCLESSSVRQYINQLGRVPRVQVGEFKKVDVDEHISTAVISTNMAFALNNSGKLNFVAGGDIRNQIRTERQDQQSNASEATAAALGNENAADLMLTGTVMSIVDKAGNRTSRSYTVRAELADIETGDIIWSGLNTDINKTIVTPRVKF